MRSEIRYDLVLGGWMVLGPYRDGPGNPILRSRGKAAGPTEGPQEAP